jgi:Asp-tRNA(Asn)/Glu-tRNA(Gln) amidotransferase A subunit family amidase
MLAMDRGDLTSETLTAACLKRIGDRDSDVQAWSWIDEDFAMTGARAADEARRRGDRLGPLHGLPIGVKDVMLTHDMPTQYNSPLYKDFRPGLDAACVAVLRSAGAVMLGKTHTVEFAATGRPPPTRNPRDRSRTPGGSSSGSAAAVADGHVPLALGTQTGGSIVRPASYCGVWGLKPTWGLVSTEGCKAFAPSLDTVGWFARTVGDLSLLLDVFDPPLSPATQDPPRLRVAVFSGEGWDAVSEDTRAALEASVAALTRAGCLVEPFDAPSGFDDLPALHRTVMRGEGRAGFLAQVRADPSRLHESIAAMVSGDTVVSREALRGAYGLADKARVAFEAAATGFDAVLAPSAVGEAPKGLGSTGGFGLNGGWTLLHGPVVNVPGFRGSHGMPVGVTLAGARFNDRRVLAVAELLARALIPWTTESLTS